MLLNELGRVFSAERHMFIHKQGSRTKCSELHSKVAVILVLKEKWQEIKLGR